MNVRPRLLVSTFVSTKRAGMSSKTKSPTHYETLEVNPRATQGEIKSAYFKLSKQYHPDKNSSDEAISKFRGVAEAYEVLGNYNSRKTYDRSILTKTRYHGPQESEKSADPKIKYYQAQAAVFRQSGKSGSTPMYDFDAWTKAHYGKTLNRTFRDKKEAARKREDRQYDSVRQGGSGLDVGLVAFVFVFITTLLMLSIKKPVWDDPAMMIHKGNELSQSEIKSRESAAASLSSKQ